ncbi:protein-tyrosine phosphatase-like protein [Linnemannia elongata]|nr:protein-tyrosine phosphatase-like protein [Linnemannia elongata]
MQQSAAVLFLLPLLSSLFLFLLLTSFLLHSRPSPKHLLASQQPPPKTQANLALSAFVCCLTCLRQRPRTNTSTSDSELHSLTAHQHTDPAITSSQLMDYIKIAKVNAVQLEKGQSTYIGTLHLTAHHLIFFHPDQEIWISYPTIHTVEKGLPTVHNAWPLHIRCHNFVFVALNFQSEKDVTDVYESIQKLTCISSVEQLYAFFYTPSPAFKTTDGWQIYDPLLEYERMGVMSKSDQWRVSELNRTYTFSPTYPQLIVVPSKISDTVLQYAAKHRSKARIPALSYLHWNNMASITRSSQPMVGLKQNRSIQDEKLIEAIFMTNVPQSSSGNPVYGSTATNLIIDARPTANAMANTAVGAGTENMENYRNCKKVYSGIDNIHVMRDSLNKLVEALQEIDTKGSVNKPLLQKSGWLRHIGAVMDGAVMIVRNIHISSSHVLVHCSDGWDRTAQLTSVAQICLDPYYRTLRGFQVLVEKEWCSFGYKFMDRCGHLSNDKNFVALSATNSAANTFANVQNKFINNKHIRETSPIFHQFLDCVFQTMHQNPKRFEFNEYFLMQLHYHVYSCQFGNFLFNCQKDRREYNATTKCASIWDFINSSKEEYLNKDYDQSIDKARGGDEGVLFPDTKAIKYWSKLFGRTDEELNSPDDNTNLSNPLNDRMTPELLGFGNNYAESVASGEVDHSGDERVESDPLGIGSSTSTAPPRSSARVNNLVRAGTPTGGTQVSEGEDSWQKSADNLASKFPAALSGAFGGGFVDSFNRLTMNVRDTWYASSTPSGPNSQYGEDSAFADMRTSGAVSQNRAATLGRSSSNRHRGTVDREMRSISGAPAPASTQSQSNTPSPKHSLADLTLEHEIDPLRSSGGGAAFRGSPNGSNSSSRPATNSRQQQAAANTSPKESVGRLTPRVASPDLSMTLPSSGAVEPCGVTTIERPASPVPEQPKEPVKELPHPLFVE